MWRPIRASSRLAEISHGAWSRNSLFTAGPPSVLSSRYNGEVGDIVVGRVTEVTSALGWFYVGEAGGSSEWGGHSVCSYVGGTFIALSSCSRPSV